MARPEIEDFVSYSLSSVDGIGTYDELAKYSKAQDEFIDHQATEITSLKEQLKGDSEECCASYKSILLKEIEDLKEQLEKEREKIKEAYTDGFSDSRFDFDIENYIE